MRLIQQRIEERRIRVQKEFWLRFIASLLFLLLALGLSLL